MSVKMAIFNKDLKGSFSEKWLFQDSIEMIIVSFFGNKFQTHLLMCDLVHLRFSTVNEIRAKVSRQLNILDSDIILHCTHDHTGPSEPEMNIGVLIEKIIEGVQENKKNQVEAKMALVSVDTKGELNINRRKIMPHGMGKFTVWTGCEEKEGKFDGSRIAIRRLKDWMGEDFELNELKKPLFYDEDERDTLLQAVFFKNKNDQIIGSIVRFCGHPAVAAHTTNRRYSADYPGEVRRIMKEKFGGEHGFLTGPCGNIIMREKAEWLPLQPGGGITCMLPTSKMKEENDCFKEANRIAGSLVEYIEKNLPHSSDYSDIKTLTSQLIEFKLELRNDLCRDSEVANKECQKIQEDLLINRNNYTLAKIKELVDKANFYGAHRYFNKGYVSKEDYTNGFITINIPSFKINDLIFQGMPGETFWETGLPIRRWADDNNIPLVTFSFANGSSLYLPTDEERPFGDYEVVTSICREGEITKLSNEILNCGKRL